MPSFALFPVTGRAPWRPLLARIAVLGVLLPGLLGGVLAAGAAPAQAASSLGYRAVSEASHHRGQPYSYGAAGPDRFDCSGFTLYVFGRLGHRLPHNSASQYDAVRHISRSHLQVGDLLFFGGSSGIYHVAIYAGDGQMWHATHSGDVVRLAPIYSSDYLVGRVG